MKKIVFTIILTSICLGICKSQKINLKHTIWQSKKESSRYKLFLNTKLIWLGDYSSIDLKEISLLDDYYGFYDTCEPPRIDSLKISGAYYFEISDSYVDDTGKITDNNLGCLELNVFKNNKETMINIYDSSSQQFFTYKKIEKLPQNLEVYLKREHPSIYEDYLKMQKTPTSNSKKITAKKSLIHSSPNKPTKMYLIKGNEVEVLGTKNEWVKILYFGKKTIEGWVRKVEVGK